MISRPLVLKNQWFYLLDQLDNLDNIAPHNHPRNNPEKFGMDNNHNNHIDDCKAIDNSNQIPDL